MFDNFFVYEGGWFQFLTALSFFSIGVVAIIAGGQDDRKFIYYALAFAGVFAAVDELNMVHECLKISLFKGMHTDSIRDIPVLIYGISAIGFSVFNFLRISKSIFNVLPSAGLFLSASLVLLVDVFGVYRGPNGRIAEEIAELFCGLFAIWIVTMSYKNRTNLKKVTQSLVLCTGVLILLFLLSNQFKSHFCPSLYSKDLFFH